MRKFSLPNLRQGKPQVFCNYIFNRKSYNFNFSICGDILLLDIYLLQDNGNNYIIKGFPVTPNVDIIERVKNSSLISGKLFIRNKYGKDEEPDMYTLNTDFELVYYEKDEVVE